MDVNGLYMDSSPLHKSKTLKCILFIFSAACVLLMLLTQILTKFR